MPHELATLFASGVVGAGLEADGSVEPPLVEQAASAMILANPSKRSVTFFKRCPPKRLEMQQVQWYMCH